MKSVPPSAASALVSGPQLQRLERFFPPLVLISAVLVVASAREPGWTAVLAALFMLGNMAASAVRYRTPDKTDLIERLRFAVNLPLISLLMLAAGPASPAWLFLVPGALWVPVAIRERWLQWLLLLSSVGLSIAFEATFNPQPTVGNVLVPPFVLVAVSGLTHLLLNVAVASERALAGHILNSVQSNVLMCDTKGRISYLNRPIPPLTHERVLGANIMDFTPEGAKERVADIVRGVLESARPEAYEVDARSGPAGCWLKVYVSPVAWEGEVHGLVFVLHDITDQKSLEADLRQARDRAERLSRARSDFLAVVNHEVRTPVNALLAGLDLLESALPRLNREERDLMQTMKKSGVHLRAQVNNLLNMSRFTHKKERLNHEPFDLRALVDEMLAMYSLQLAPGVFLSSTIEAELPCHFYGDSQRWQTILRNLLSNAVKFTREGTVSLEVSWHDESRTSIRLLVEDTGSGIAPEHQALIFEPFTQFPVSGERQQGGVGLGLSLCGANVHLLGGKIQVESALGHGSRFTCTLPVQPCTQWSEQGRRHDSCGLCVTPAQGLHPVRDRSTSALEPGRMDVVGVRILIVEDDDVNRMVLEKLLNREGLFQIALAGNGAEALMRMDGATFDVVLLDMHLPDLSGTEIARMIRARGWTGRIIAVTADTTPDMQDLALLSGIDHFSPKPLDMADLMASIRQAARGGADV